MENRVREVEVTTEKKKEFAVNGFVHFSGVVEPNFCEELLSRFEPMFRGEFETGIYPDEWHWRKGISKDNAFREIVNGWKSDGVIRSLVSHPNLGKIASDLLDWPGSRIGQDDLLWKPPQSRGVGVHRDGEYISKQFSPEKNNSVTIWVALDDADSKSGVVQYVKGSHLDFSKKFKSGFFEDDTIPQFDAKDMIALSVKKGDILCHHQDVLHGSSDNLTSNRPRRAIGVHLIRNDVEWSKTNRIDYIYGRYRILGEDSPREEFFPTTYNRNKPLSKI